MEKMEKKKENKNNRGKIYPIGLGVGLRKRLCGLSDSGWKS